jgi:hypothetical protein
MMPTSAPSPTNALQVDHRGGDRFDTPSAATVGYVATTDGSRLGPCQIVGSRVVP